MEPPRLAQPRGRTTGAAQRLRRVALPLTIVTVLLCSVPGAAQSDRQRADALARRATDRIRALQAEAAQLARQERTILNELRQLEIDRRLKAEELAGIDAALLATSSELEAVSREAELLERQVVEAAPAVGARLASLYKMGRPGYWRLLLDVDDVRGVGRAYRTMAAVARLDRERVTAHEHRLQSLKDARVALEERTRSIRRLHADAAAARTALDRAIATRNARVNAIDRQRDLTAQLTGELQDAQRTLQASLAELAAGRSADLALPIQPFRGALAWPVRGEILIPFGKQRASRFGTSIVRNGVDIAAAEGNAVNGVHEGTVAYAGPFTGFGNLVILEHGRNSFSLYGHLETITVKKGDRIERQRQLGTVGRTPTGKPALYFELRIDGRPVNPLQWLQR